MNDTTDDGRRQLRRGVYMLLILLGTGTMLGRIAAVDDLQRTLVGDRRFEHEVDVKVKKLRDMGLEGRQFDLALEKEKKRLRRSLQRSLQRRPFLSANDRSRMCTVRALVDDDMRVEGHPYSIDKVIQQPGWNTIDMVKHDGHLYSSKPPLFPTLMAGEYWVIKRLTGMTLQTHPFTIARCLLITVNLLPLILYFVLLAGLIERFGSSDWGRIFVMGAAVFGTFLTTFAVVINNHLPAAVCAMIALYAAVRIWFDDERRPCYFFIAGLFAAGTAANELPALAFLGLLSLVLLWKAPWQTIFTYVPAVLLVVAAFLATNWIAHEDLRPPYLHRSEGDNWYDYSYEIDGEPCESYWNNRVGLDVGEPSPLVYGMHILVGHHGIFSLTPLWILSVAGLIIWLLPGRDRRLQQLALLIGLTSVVCLAFYLSRPEHHRNYGGMTCGLRWMFWFAPLWLVAMIPAADALARRWWTRLIAGLLLVASVFSVTYPLWNPWSHPWLMHYLQYWGCL